MVQKCTVQKPIVPKTYNIAPNIIRFPETEEENNQVATEFEQVYHFYIYNIVIKSSNKV